MDLNSLIAECTAYDFKVMLEEKKPKSWLKSVSAFANGLGGSLLFGIDNDAVINGFDDVQHVCETISSKISDYMDPLPEVEMIPHDIEGLHVLQLKVKLVSLMMLPLASLLLRQVLKAFTAMFVLMQKVRASLLKLLMQVRLKLSVLMA